VTDGADGFTSTGWHAAERRCRAVARSTPSHGETTAATSPNPIRARSLRPPIGEVAQLLDGRREVGDSGVEAIRLGGPALIPQPRLGGAQRYADRDEALLSAVVETALDAAPLTVIPGCI
jgi:hypothetical protein